MLYQVVTAVKIRVDDTFIPDECISSTYLARCFERKGLNPGGFIRGLVDKFARHGQKKVSFSVYLPTFYTLVDFRFKQILYSERFIF